MHDLSGLHLLLVIITFKFKRAVYFYRSPFLQHNKESREFGIFWWWVPNNQTKEPVCEAESARIHLRWAKQACWQGNTSGEGQQSTLWPCWRQWHNSNSCRVRASSLQSRSPSLCCRLQLKPDAALRLKLTAAKSQNKTGHSCTDRLQEALYFYTIKNSDKWRKSF